MDEPSASLRTNLRVMLSIIAFFFLLWNIPICSILIYCRIASSAQKGCENMPATQMSYIISIWICEPLSRHNVAELDFGSLSSDWGQIFVDLDLIATKKTTWYSFYYIDVSQFRSENQSDIVNRLTSCVDWFRYAIESVYV